MSEQKSSRLVTYVVFLFSLGVIGISLVSISFPAMIISSTYDFPLDIDPFEASPWLLQITITAIIILGIYFLYLRKKLPAKIHDTIEYILNLLAFFFF